MKDVKVFHYLTNAFDLEGNSPVKKFGNDTQLWEDKRLEQILGKHLNEGYTITHLSRGGARLDFSCTVVLEKE